MKVALGALVGALGIHFAMVACGVARLPGRDGGGDSSVEDAFAPQEADAQTPPASFTSACTQQSVFSAVADGGVSGTTQTTYYAEISVPGLDPQRAPRFATVLCDLEIVSNQYCAPGTTCTTTGYTLPSDACRVSEFGGTVRPGAIVVFCGSSTTSVDSMGRRTTTTDRARQATVVIR